MPEPLEVAAVAAEGDRLLFPGTFNLVVSRGHGATIKASVTLTGAARTLQSWPRPYRAGSQVALDWCSERGLDVIPHAERLPAKLW